MEQDDDNSSFLPDWTLPELPKPTPLSTTGLEDIFGESETGSNLPPLIGLQDVDETLGTGSHDDSSGPLILSSIEESLEEMKPPGGGLSDVTTIDTTTTITTTSTAISDNNNNNKITQNSLTEQSTIITSESTDTNNNGKDKEKEDSLITPGGETAAVSDVIQEETIDTTIKEEKEKTGEEKEEEEEEGGHTVRRSKRVRTSLIKREEEEEIQSTSDTKSDIIKQEKEGTTTTTASSGIKQEKSIKMEEEEKEEEEEREEDDDDTSEYADSDDPDKVWCICQQPHDDRFMICCDRCGEWYHGDCVGITIAEGKRMEKCGQDYICVRCNDYDANSKAERAKNRSLRQSRRENIRAKQIAELVGKRQGGSVQSPTSSSSSGSVVKKEKMTRACGGPGCDKLTSVSSIYCNEGCIKKHIEFSLKKLQIRGLSRGSSTPGEFGKGSGGVTVLDTLTKKILTGLSAPSEKSLLPWLKAHPSYKIYVPPLKGATPNKKAPPTRKSHDDDNKNEADGTTPSGPKISETNTRKLAQKAFQHALQTRTQLLPEEERVPDSNVSTLAIDIETKLYNLHNQEVNQKYRTKCRSLLFNLKDTKNQGLFKKLLCGELTTRELVRMTPEQLASDELAQWRQKTIKKELEMITEVAKEALEMSSSSVVRKMTYKGEIEIERNTDISLAVDVPLKGQEEVTSTTNEIKDTPPTSSNNLTTVKTEPSSIINSLLNDTTDQHGSHVFDQNCTICTRSNNNPSVQGVKIEEEEEEEKEEKELTSNTQTNPSFSPDSRDDRMEHVVTSPDSISQPYVAPPISSTLQSLWKGNITMHAMPTFSATAYHVSGRAQGLSEVFPETLQIIGRIAHVQVWDYIDKLKCSTSKEVVVLRFERIEEDSSPYVEMMDYLIQKRRYGVMQCTAHVKDMYIIPLLCNQPVPPQLLPFDGPGLPFNRKDTFLCVITRHKNVVISQETPRKRKYSGHVRFSSVSSPSEVVTPQEPPEKKSHTSQPQVEIGFGGATPPTTPPAIKVSFYGDSRESFDKKPSPVKPTKSEGSETLSKVTGLSQSGIKSILSTLSDSKLQELASAMSTIQPSSSLSPSTTPSSSQPQQQETHSNITSINIATSERGEEVERERITATTESRLSLDERLSALQSGTVSSSLTDNNAPTTISGTTPSVTTPTDHTPLTLSNVDRTNEQSTAYQQSMEQESSYSEKRPTSSRYTYTRYDEEGAAQHYRDAYHGNQGYHGYPADPRYREEYRHDRYEQHQYPPPPHHPYWRDREYPHPGSYNRKNDGNRYMGGEDRRYERREDERSGHYSSSYHHHRPSRWNN